MKIVLSDVDDFVMESQNSTDDEISEARRLTRKIPQHPLVKSDIKWPEILRGFIELVEDALDDVSEVNIDEWLSNFIHTDGGLTHRSELLPNQNTYI